LEYLGFYLYLIFIVSWFLQLPTRIPVLGIIRFDLILIISILCIYIFFIDKQKIKGRNNPTYNRMLLMIGVILIVTPLAEWPGSAIQFGIPNFIKGIVFFFFTVWFLQSERKLKIFIIIFIACQIFRILEPLYLHITQGYWGSVASMANWQFMDRLSGAPADIINPNGLAFVILTVLPFLLNFYHENLRWRLTAIFAIPTALYALYLTGSRSGMVGFGVILFVMLIKSKRKALLMVAILTGSVLAFANMSGNFKDRYVSIVSSDSANAATAQGRLDGIWVDFKVALRKPFVGHGLGTSREANANFGNKYQISHTLYTEILQEIGFVGFFFFMFYLYSIFCNLSSQTNIKDNNYFSRFNQSLLMFAFMSIIFSIFSYGLSSYEWYLLGSLSILNKENIAKLKDPEFSIK